jgi:hypothetical protein
MSLSQTYTQSELNNIICKLDYAISLYAYKAGKKKLFNVGTGDFDRLKIAVTYRWVLNDWEQYSNGLTTGFINRITQDEFTNLLNNVKKLLA